MRPDFGYLLFALLSVMVTARIFNERDYLNGSNFINWSACEFPTNTPDRLRWLDELLLDTQRTLGKWRLSSWIVQSSLLGLVRDGQTMPWTWDVDMQMFSCDIAVLCNQSSPVHLEMRSQGYRITDCMKDFARVCRVRTTPGTPKYISTGEPVEARLDLYGATLNERGLYSVGFSNCEWNLTAHLYPLRPYQWTKGVGAHAGRTILGPRDYNYWLQFGYGFNWTIPEKYGGGRADLCVYDAKFDVSPNHLVGVV